MAFKITQISTVNTSVSTLNTQYGCYQCKYKITLDSNATRTKLINYLSENPNSEFYVLRTESAFSFKIVDIVASVDDSVSVVANFIDIGNKYKNALGIKFKENSIGFGYLSPQPDNIIFKTDSYIIEIKNGLPIMEGVIASGSLKSTYYANNKNFFDAYYGVGNTTRYNTFTIGDGVTDLPYFSVKTSSDIKPKLQFNRTTNFWEISSGTEVISFNKDWFFPQISKPVDGNGYVPQINFDANGKPSITYELVNKANGYLKLNSASKISNEFINTLNLTNVIVLLGTATLPDVNNPLTFFQNNTVVNSNNERVFNKTLTQSGKEEKFGVGDLVVIPQTVNGAVVNRTYMITAVETEPTNELIITNITSMLELSSTNFMRNFKVQDNTIGNGDIINLNSFDDNSIGTAIAKGNISSNRIKWEGSTGGSGPLEAIGGIGFKDLDTDQDNSDIMMNFKSPLYVNSITKEDVFNIRMRKVRTMWYHPTSNAVFLDTQPNLTDLEEYNLYRMYIIYTWYKLDNSTSVPVKKGFTNYYTNTKDVLIAIHKTDLQSYVQLNPIPLTDEAANKLNPELFQKPAMIVDTRTSSVLQTFIVNTTNRPTMGKIVNEILTKRYIPFAFDATPGSWGTYNSGNYPFTSSSGTTSAALGFDTILTTTSLDIREKLTDGTVTSNLPTINPSIVTHKIMINLDEAQRVQSLRKVIIQ